MVAARLSGFAIFAGFARKQVSGHHWIPVMRQLVLS